MTTNILLVTAGIYHPPILGRYRLRRCLETLGGFVFQRCRTLEALSELDLNKYRAMVLYYHHKSISDSALETLDRFVSSGGGLLAVHSATASFQNRPAYFKILGGRFSGHGPVESFQVLPNSAESEIFGAIPGFTVRDELYLHELEPGIQSHYYAEYQGERAPMVWTYQYGAGKVCYACPGHLAKTLTQPEYLEILKQGLKWVCNLE